MDNDEKRDFEEMMQQAMIEELVHHIVNDKQVRDFFFRRLSELMHAKTIFLGGRKV